MRQNSNLKFIAPGERPGKGVIIHLLTAYLLVLLGGGLKSILFAVSR